MKPIKVLFLLKLQSGYGHHHHHYHPDGWAQAATGIKSSVRFIVDMLHEIGVSAHLEIVVDGNAIDKAVTEHKPTHVILEALWVTPDKLAQLVTLHPSIKWNVRLHSELPFLAMEGIAMQWLFAYLKLPRVTVSTNSKRGQADYTKIFNKPTLYTPNYYPEYPLEKPPWLLADDILDVGCFGAIRPLKNQFTQAVAALEWANQTKRTIRFHMNTDRVEQGGTNVLRNIRNLFANSDPHTLVEHKWMPHDEFMDLIRHMDIGMQVSLSETFNIVSADFAIAGVPMVVSPEVTWAGQMFQAQPNSTTSISTTMSVAWAGRQHNLQKINYEGLMAFDVLSAEAWPVALMGMN